MGEVNETGRVNQRRRTRKELLSAAARLLKENGGRAPDMDEVAAAALVSRATAYRYFPSIESLLTEAPIDGAVPSPGELFAGDESGDPAARIDKAERVLHEMCFRNQAQLRVMLAASLGRGEGDEKQRGDRGMPVRQNRRTALIEAALAPARDQFTDEAYEKLCAALAMIFGVESMIVFTDVLSLDEKEARRVKSWAATTLVRAALEESRR